LRKLNKEEILNFSGVSVDNTVLVYSLFVLLSRYCIIGVAKQWDWQGLVICVGKILNACKVLIAKPKSMRLFERCRR
jgi:hypothetical protein